MLEEIFKLFLVLLLLIIKVNYPTNANVLLFRQGFVSFGAIPSAA